MHNSDREQDLQLQMIDGSDKINQYLSYIIKISNHVAILAEKYIIRHFNPLLHIAHYR